ncbi:amidohydrolase family protein [Actinomadura sp. LD22]|uniref:Amidohydrolase family protein n=1 Tax=Actinomadura physcomitrii TaxID=2650748 RepID=A0A6I4M6E1_9ACTN|nr:amidohydrolase family protein [Actinomadura physcomitrii]MVZ99843.1 amidohydrolase family protein [Actinomadura physcomitrii]
MTVAPERSVTFLPEPIPEKKLHHLVISTDDHLIEPANMFEGRIPSKFGDRGPKIITVDGVEAWKVEDQILHNMGLNAVAGRPPEEWDDEPTNFEELRRGCFDIEARIHDMDLNGVYASLCFPSKVAGFGGARFAELKDRELGLACAKAWNDWYYEEWMSPHPDRIIGLQVPWLLDGELGAQEVYRNAARGVRALSFPEVPSKLGLPSLASGHYDPIFRACEETGTVIALHTGSSGMLNDVDDDLGRDVFVALFPAYALLSGMSWLYSGVPSKFPGLKISLAEGGIGWVAMMFDRLEYIQTHAGMASTFDRWRDTKYTPAEVFARNFWFCTFDDPSALQLRDRIGLDKITIEVDYPHADGSWPKSQPVLAELLKDIPKDEAEKITWRNAAKLFQHEVPADIASGERDYRTTIDWSTVSE